MSMSIFMSHQYEPIFWLYTTDINQDRHGLGLKITECIKPKRLRQRSRKDLDDRLFPSMKTSVTSLKANIQLSIDGLNLLTNPDADWSALSHIRN